MLGWDVAGELVAMGSAGAGVSVGDAVHYAGDLPRPGGTSEFHAVNAAIVGHRPTSLTPAQAAALPLTALTAWETLFDRFGLSPDASLGDRLRVVAVMRGETVSVGPDVTLLDDGTGAFAAAYGSDELALLVRPDGHVGWRGRTWRDPGLQDYLERMFCLLRVSANP